MNQADETILLDLLDPSSRIEPEYRSYIIATKNGKTFTGILASETATNVLLRQEKGETETILRSDIETMKVSDVSLMPSNLHLLVSPKDACNLIGFLRRAHGASRR